MSKLYNTVIAAVLLMTSRAAGQNISGVVNDYREVTAVGVNSVVVSPDAAPFACGDRVVVIQMQGATISTANDANFGNITAYNSAGKYEFAVVASVTGSQINFSANLLNSYNVTGAVQVVRVPVYVNPTVVTGNKVSSVRLTSCGCRYTAAPTVSFSGGGGTGAAATARINSRGQVIAIDVTNPGTGYTSAPTVNISNPSPAPTDFSATMCRARAIAVVRELTAKQWDGKIGGVLAIETPGTLTLNENIDVTGMGFRGGTPGNTTSSSTAYRVGSWTANILNGEKGEAIGLNDDAHARGFGKYANGGGGARQREGGGAGGGNGGAGGRGGNQNAAIGAATTPAEGGLALLYSNAENRVFLGGGGGGGAAENSSLTGHVSVPGGYGGGIVIIRAASVATSGSKSIVSNGTSNHVGFLTGASIEDLSGGGIAGYGDGASGGGAGGTLVLQVPAAGFPATLTLSANGANGGNNSRNESTPRYGPGGGGGGGTVWTSGGVGSATANVVGGQGGWNRNSGSWIQHGAAAGNNGVSLSGLAMPGPGLSCSHIANAGPDQPAVPTLSATLDANVPICGETGSWSLVSGPGTATFSPVTAYNATVTVSTAGTYTFRWTLVKDGCPVTDDVEVTFTASCVASTANAGTDKYYCSGSVAMTANTPPVGETGAWSMVSGPGTASFVNPTNPTTNVSFTPNGNYVLRWTISKPGCASTEDDVNVTQLVGPTILAPTAILCNGFTANWAAVPGAASYRMDVALDAAFTIPVYTNVNAGTGTSYNVTGLVANTKYFYRIRVGSPCASSNSAVADVTTVMPTSVNWLGGGSNNWFSSVNWSCGVVPNPSISAVIDNATAPAWWPVISGGTAECNNLTITSTVASTATRLHVTGATAVLNVHGNMTVNANTTLPGFTMVVENGAKLYNNLHPSSSALFGPAVTFPSTYFNKKQLRVSNPGSEAQFRQLNITAGVPCAIAGDYITGSISTFYPWGNACAHPGVHFTHGSALDVAGNLTIGWAGSAFEGILWLDNSDGNVSGDVNIYNQFTGAASRGIGLKNGATFQIVGLLSTQTDGASLILENYSYAWIGALHTNTNFGLPSGASVVNSTLYVDGDAHLRQNCGIAVLGTDASDLIVGGNLLINTSFPVAALSENLIAKGENPDYPAFISVDGIFEMGDRRRALLWENSSMTVSGIDMSGSSVYIRTNASCTLRTASSLYSGGHLNLGGTSGGDTCSRIVMDGAYYSEPTLFVSGDLNLLPNSQLDASSPVVRPIIQLTGNWNRSVNNVISGPNKRGFARGNSMVSFIGSSGQQINTPGADPIERFHGLEINSFGGTTLIATAKAEVYDLLLLTDGILNTGAAGNYVWVRNNSPAAVNRVQGHVNGWLYRDVAPHSSFFEFPVGRGGMPPAYTHFRRLGLKFNAISGFDRVDVKFNDTPSINAGACPVIDGLPIDAATTGANGFWSVNPNSGVYITDYDMRLHLYGMGTFGDNLFLAVSRNDGETNCNDWKGGGLINPTGGMGRMVADGYALRMNLPFFSEKALASASTPLAVELLNFNAQVQNDRVLLTWDTRNETNNDYFAIERSTERTGFSEIGRVKGSGSTFEPQSYRTFDLAPLPGTSYYRLKQTDFDGKFAYSHTVSVTFEASGDQVLLYPNPAHNGVNARIRYTSTREHRNVFQLFDLTGRKVWEETREERNGDIEIPTSSLTAGVYLFKTNLSPTTQKLAVN